MSKKLLISMGLLLTVFHGTVVCAQGGGEPSLKKRRVESDFEKLSDMRNKQLILAALAGKLEVIRRLLAAGADANAATV